MGKIILELSDEDLLQLGEQKIKEEVGQTLKWLKMKHSCRQFGTKGHENVTLNLFQGLVN